MKVSIVVPVYNVAPYIEQFARSIFDQTLDDIEYVFVDDCTPDSSIEILLSVLEEYPQRKPNVKIIRHEKNMGIAVSRKDGYMKSTGEYVIYVDSDDYLEPRMLELMYAKAKEHDADMIVCDIYLYYKENCNVLKTAPKEEGENGEKIKDDIINRKVTPGLWCKLFRRSVLSENEALWPVRSYAEDVVISTYLAYSAKRIEYVNEPLYHYLYHDTSICNKNTKEQCLSNIDGYKRNIDVVVRFLKEKGVYDKYRFGVYLNKFYVKKLTMPFFRDKEFRKLWFDTYPELNRILFWGDDIYKSSYRQKIWMVAIKTGLILKFKRRLQSKRFLPSPRWIFR